MTDRWLRFLGRLGFLQGLSRLPVLRHVERWSIRFFDYSIVSHYVTSQVRRPYVPTLLLITGDHARTRVTPLFYFAHGDGCVVVGSRGGAPRDPRWAQDLFANPLATVIVKRRKRKVRAIVASGPHRTELWALVVAGWPAYEEYRLRAHPREIPVFVLSPEGSAGPHMAKRDGSTG